MGMQDDYVLCDICAAEYRDGACRCGNTLRVDRLIERLPNYSSLAGDPSRWLSGDKWNKDIDLTLKIIKAAKKMGKSS